MKFSIVIPCYNKGSFVRRAVESCKLGAAAVELEIICVDDYSSDITLEVLEEIAKENANLKIVRHTENKRTMEARRSGIEEATGDYILFLDPDDRFEEGALDIIAESLNANPVDVLFFGAKPVVDGDFAPPGRIEILTPLMTPPENCSSRDKILELAFVERKLMPNVCGKAWKREVLVEGLRFVARGPFLTHEDLTHSLASLYFAKTVSTTTQTLYLYTIDTGICQQGITRGENAPQRLSDFAMVLKSTKAMRRALSPEDPYLKYIRAFENGCIVEFTNYCKDYLGAFRSTGDFDDCIAPEHLGLIAIYKSKIDIARQIIGAAKWFFYLYKHWLKFSLIFVHGKARRAELKTTINHIKKLISS